MKFDRKISRRALAILIAGSALTVVGSANACSSEEYLGSICMTAATYCPKGYMEAQGQLLPINSYTALFSLLGTNYGGDGRNTFGLPDLRGRTPVGLGAGPGLSIVEQGQKRGAETVTLNANNLPPHTHPATATLTASTSPGSSAAPVANSSLGTVSAERGTTPQTLYTPTATTTVGLKGVAVTVEPNATPNQAINTVPPQQGVRYCIAVEGLYPPRE